jgi:hypothetical protein
MLRIWSVFDHRGGQLLTEHDDDSRRAERTK